LVHVLLLCRSLYIFCVFHCERAAFASYSSTRPPPPGDGHPSLSPASSEHAHATHPSARMGRSRTLSRLKAVDFYRKIPACVFFFFQRVRRWSAHASSSALVPHASHSPIHTHTHTQGLDRVVADGCSPVHYGRLFHRAAAADGALEMRNQAADHSSGPVSPSQALTLPPHPPSLTHTQTPL
jgi:hypothetical protein